MTPVQRLEAFRQLANQARDRLGLKIGIILWDGSTIPADLPPGALAIKLADEGVVAALVRRPRMETLSNLYVTKRLDLVNGDIFDLVAARRKGGVRTREFVKQLDKIALAKLAFAFWNVDRGGPWPLDELPTEKPSAGSAAENKKNISYHYDVSNAFYALWLDQEMVYSCGYCADWTDDIDRMQQNKLDMICRKLRLKPGDRLLDIGCGWGALCCFAARHYGVTAYGVTLSEQQLAYGQAKVKRLGLEDKVRLELKDYAAIEGTFDKIASVGMHEHIGIDNYSNYYDTVKRVLQKDGLFLHHAITRPAKRNDRLFRRKRPEFALLTRYIFPGGEVDHIGNTVASLERHGFEVHDVEGWREHYQRTCKHWHDRLLANYDAAVAEVGEVKTRLWLIYLGGCSIGFERAGALIFQTLASPRKRGPSGLPTTRADLYR